MLLPEVWGAPRVLELGSEVGERQTVLGLLCLCRDVPVPTEGDSLRKRKKKAAGALAAAGEHCLFHLTIVLCVAGRDLLFHKFGWKGELGRALGCREGFTAALAALCSPCRAGAPAEMP